MKQFMDEDFLLMNDTAKTLYHDYAAKMPIIDYHCHVSPQEIFEDKAFENITEVWLGGDHYKWRMIRAMGVDEKYITGDSTAKEKFDAFAKALPYAIGNPLYHWTHLELKRYFDCDLPLNEKNADEIWEICNKKLQSGFTVRKIIEASGVTHICTTDDPIDNLEWHKKIAADDTFKTVVLPAFRPDKAVNVHKEGFKDYLLKLGEAAGVEIKTLDDVKTALGKRIQFFDDMGCVASDHGLDYIPCLDDEVLAEAALAKVLVGEVPSVKETEAYITSILTYCGKEYARRGWVMQYHFGAIRSVNTERFKQLGPDTGFDTISTRDNSEKLVQILDLLKEKNGKLPKTIIYSLNPNDDAMIGAAIGAFQGTEVPGQIQHGSAWWFNDTKAGMEKQMKTLASLGVLSNFVGMLTDSRSFLSYTRHEYFRRILCNMLGTWVEEGMYPNDLEFLGQVVQDISYNNAIRYMGLKA